MKNLLDKFSFEHKKVFLFILINLIVWPLLGMIRLVLPTDSLEGIFWGSLQDFGTPKHPPLAAWITYYVYSVFKTDYSIYLLCTVFILTGLLYIYKLAKFFVNDQKAILSAVIMEGCWTYTYVISYYGFNPDVVLLCFLPMLTYYAYKALFKNSNLDWIKLGIITGLSFLDKYQTVLILLPLFIWACIFKREIFKNKYFYFSVIIAFLIFLPHLIWLIQHDFFSFIYFQKELKAVTTFVQLEPIIFVFMQFVSISGTLVIFAILMLSQKSKFKLKISFNEKSLFLLLIGFSPLVINLILGIASGGSMRPRWGYEFLFLTGIMLFYFIPTKEISKKDFSLVFKLTYIAIFLVFLTMLILLSVEKNYRSRYPVLTFYNDLNTSWNEQVHSPLKYLGGYIEWTLPISIYAKTHPACILDTYGYKNPWIDEEDLKKSGIIIIDRTKEDVVHRLYDACPYLDKNITVAPVEYKLRVKNALNMEREYIIYYLIVPPIESNIR